MDPGFAAYRFGVPLTLCCARDTRSRPMASTPTRRKRRRMPPKSKPNRRSDHRDTEVGRRVRTQRLTKGLSQTELGTKIGVTFQQVQKYENGGNRIGAGRLSPIAEALEVPASFFFPDESASPSPAWHQDSSPFALLSTAGRIPLVLAHPPFHLLTPPHPPPPLSP